jgi:hypothetical protein
MSAAIANAVSLLLPNEDVASLPLKNSDNALFFDSEMVSFISLC